MKKEDDFLVEISWEVCNKVGGIYTVISSKASYINQEVKNYFLVGPYKNPGHVQDFVEELPPEELKPVFNELKNEGIPCIYGKWLIKSEPKVVLIDFSNVFSELNNIKSKLWEIYRVDSLNSNYEFDEPVAFSVASAKFLDKLEKITKKKIVAQFHEWLTGAGLLWCRDINKNIKSIFTTHATVLGRSMVGSDPDFYSNLEGINPDEEAKKHWVLNKHGIEKASAQNADVFTTVSEITGIEAGHILGRKPDIILPNGIDLENFASFEELSIKHSELKHHTKDFVMSFFFPYHTFNIDNTFIFFIIGRYEYQNKGIDIFIEALGRLNQKLKKEKSDKTIVSFFFIPADSYGINHNVLESKTQFNDIKFSIEKEERNIMDQVKYLIISQENIKKTNLFDQKFLDSMKKKMNNFNKNGNPGYVTHDLKNYSQDAIIRGFMNNNLFNKKDDKVKVIFYPAYIKSTDNLLGLDLYDAIISGHLGVFPSAYEPWGYTPLESAALGVASVTTDLAGFGRYIENSLEKNKPGVFVNKRYGKSREEGIQDLFEILHYYTSLDKEGRIQNKIEARKIATMCDWKNLVKNYFDAYDMALEK
jgi:glycogen(starch) synthase